MDFISPVISAYAEAHTIQEDELLSRVNRETHLQVNMPRMLSGHLQGRFLALISKLIQPELIVELGTYTGYSALCLAEGLKAGGRLITIDKNKELETRVKNYFSLSPFAEQIDMRIGAATQLIPELPEPIDLAFIDADKQNYSNYYDLLLPKVRPGGLIIVDNVLWSGKVTDPQQLAKDKDTIALHAFNEKVNADQRVSALLLPLRDGLMMLQKK